MVTADISARSDCVWTASTSTSCTLRDPVVSFDASVETLAALQGEGKIRFGALSNVTQELIERARKIVPIVSIQNRYSFADREWDYVVDYCERNGIAFIPWFPLGSGKVGGMLLERIARARGEHAKAGCAGLAVEAVPGDAAHPGDFLDRALEENVQAAPPRLTDEEYRELAGVTER